MILFHHGLSNFVAKLPIDFICIFQYGDYLDRRLKVVAEKSCSLYQRAIRNCSWNSELWRRLLIALESNAATKEKVDDAYVKALGAGFAAPQDYGVVIGAYLDYMRRRCVKIEKDEAGKAVEDDKLRLFRGALEQVSFKLPSVESYVDTHL